MLDHDIRLKSKSTELRQISNLKVNLSNCGGGVSDTPNHNLGLKLETKVN